MIMGPDPMIITFFMSSRLGMLRLSLSGKRYCSFPVVKPVYSLTDIPRSRKYVFTCFTVKVPK